MNSKIIFLSLTLCLNTFSTIEAAEPDSEKTYTLQECINQAVNNLPEIAALKSKIRQQSETLRGAGLLKYPRLDTEIKYNRLTDVTPQKQRFLGESLNDFQADLILKQPLYTGGKMRAETSSARYALEAVKEEYKSALNNAIFKVKTSYYKLLYSLYIVESHQKLMEYTRWFYDTAIDLNKKTKIPREETLLRIEVQMNQVAQELISARQNYDIAKKNLLAAMGLDITGEIKIAPLPETAPGNILTTKGFDDNPDISSLQSRILEACQRTRAAKSFYYPSVNAYFSYGYEWPGLEAGDTRWIAGIDMNLSIWNWGLTKLEVNRQMERENELRKNRETLFNTLDLALESAALRYKASVEKLEIAKKNVSLAEKSLKLFEKGYNTGIVTSFELIDSQKAFAETQAGYAQSLLDMRIAVAEIERITGDYFESE